MRLSHVHIRNVLGIEDLEFDAGAFTLIEGRNGTGKSSVIESIKAVCKGGEDATLLRNGSNEGEIVLVFDDASKVRKRLTEKGQYVSYADPDGKQRGGAQTAIKQLVDVFSVNPIEFLMAPAKKRVDVLLESLPMQADHDRIRKIVGDDELPITGDHALGQIDSVYRQVFDERTGTNRAAREKEHTITQLAAALPPATEDGVDVSDESGLRAKLADIATREDAEMQRISTKLDGIRSDHGAKVSDLRRQISALEAQITSETEHLSRVAGLASQQRETSKAEFAAERAPVSNALAVIDQNREVAARAKVTRETIATLEQESADLRADSERQTAALNALLDYKSELLAALPIDGLEVKDGQIFRHGVPFDRLNKAQQVEIAVEIAKLRAGDLKVICVDDLEMLDTGHFEAFRAQAIASGLQLIVTRVSDGDFAVRSEG